MLKGGIKRAIPSQISNNLKNLEPQSVQVPIGLGTVLESTNQLAKGVFRCTQTQRLGLSRLPSWLAGSIGLPGSIAKRTASLVSLV